MKKKHEKNFRTTFKKISFYKYIDNIHFKHSNILSSLHRFLETIEYIIEWILFPFLPIFAMAFCVTYFSIGFFVHYYPNIENLTICA